MSKPLIFTFNIRRSLYELGLDHFTKHLSRFRYQNKIHIVPVVNNLGDGIQTRAAQLKRLLQSLFAEKDIEACNLVSYSLSGIDARFAISNLGLSKYVKTLTTIGAPHQGSKLAWMAERQIFADKQSEPISRLLGVGLRPFWEVAPDSMKHFNRYIKEHAQTKYFSIGGEKLPNNMNYHLRESGNYLRLRTQPNFVYENDGVFGHDETSWGQHLVNFQVDHSELIGLNNYPEYQSIITLIEDNVMAAEAEAL